MSTEGSKQSIFRRIWSFLDNAIRGEVDNAVSAAKIIPAGFEELKLNEEELQYQSDLNHVPHGVIDKLIKSIILVKAIIAFYKLFRAIHIARKQYEYYQNNKNSLGANLLGSKKQLLFNNIFYVVLRTVILVLAVMAAVFAFLSQPWLAIVMFTAIAGLEMADAFFDYSKLFHRESFLVKQLLVAEKAENKKLQRKISKELKRIQLDKLFVAFEIFSAALVLAGFIVLVATPLSYSFFIIMGAVGTQVLGFLSRIITTKIVNNKEQKEVAIKKTEMTRKRATCKEAEKAKRNEEKINTTGKDVTKEALSMSARLMMRFDDADEFFDGFEQKFKDDSWQRPDLFSGGIETNNITPEGNLAGAHREDFKPYVKTDKKPVVCQEVVVNPEGNIGTVPTHLPLYNSVVHCCGSSLPQNHKLTQQSIASSVAPIKL